MTDATIETVTAREILDNRLDPTLRVTVETTAGSGTADVPCGRSRGEHEAMELRDGGDRYGGRGVRTAVETIETEIAPELVGRDVTAQRVIDGVLLDLDGTETKERLGGNSMTGVSLATLKAGAVASDLPLYRYVGGADAHVLPVPFFDLIEGGELGASGLAFQEHQIVPVGAESFSTALEHAARIYAELGDRLADRYGRGARSVGDEGGYTPTGLEGPREAFELLWSTVEDLGFADEFALAADVAATHFYDESSETYTIAGESLTRDQLVERYESLLSSFPIISLEDPLQEGDLEGTASLTDRLGIQIVGDDLFVTDPTRLREGIDRGAGNALLFKINQVGTVTEALEAARLADRHGYAVQVSERSGQTADTWLADLAVGLNAGQIKTGVTRSERTEQYNRLLAIEDELGSTAVYGTGTLDSVAGGD